MKYKKNYTNVKTNISKNINTAIYLVIVESPSKCNKIEGFLGPQYACVATMGHLRTISGLKQINTKDKFQPSYDIITTKEDHIKNLHSVINKFNKKRIFLATDDDREGEAIAWHICEIFNLDINTNRIKFHEITQTAIINAINSPEKINIKLVESAIARQVLDVVVGFKISPMLWTYLYNNKDNPLSAGRCQTPALKLIYENENIDRSNTSFHYKIKGYFTDKSILFINNHIFDSDTEALKYINNNKQFIHTLTKGKEGKKLENPPIPFNTSNLLQFACNSMNTNSQNIMKMCQDLYQKGHITYMRTESKLFSQEFVNNCRTMISNKFGEKYVNKNDNIVNKNKNNPHEAIRVTNINIHSINDSNNPRLNTLYKIIWKNSIESCMSPANFKTIMYHISAPNNFSFDYKEEIPIFLGWKQLNNGKDNYSDNSLYLNNLVDKHVLYKEIFNECGYKGSTPYYNESSLVKTLEKLEIGRPSTFSTIIHTLIDRNYVINTDISGQDINYNVYKLENDSITQTQKTETHGNEKNKLKITNIGVMAIEFLCKHFNDLFSYDYTKKMENDLDKICTYEIEEWHTICKECYDNINEYSKSIKKIEKNGFAIDENHIFCFEKYGPIIKKIQNNEVEYFKVKPNLHDINFDSIIKNKYTVNDLIQTENIIGHYKDNSIILKHGKYGYYLEWGTTKENIKNINPLDIDLDKAIEILENKGENTNIIRYLTDYMSIRRGKFGPYIFYKTDEMAKPKFLSLKKFPEGFLTCPIENIIDWIYKTFDISR